MTGAFPSRPRYMPSFRSRIEISNTTARASASNFSNSHLSHFWRRRKTHKSRVDDKLQQTGFQHQLNRLSIVKLVVREYGPALMQVEETDFIMITAVAILGDPDAPGRRGPLYTVARMMIREKELIVQRFQRYELNINMYCTS